MTIFPQCRAHAGLGDCFSNTIKAVDFSQHTLDKAGRAYSL